MTTRPILPGITLRHMPMPQTTPAMAATAIDDHRRGVRQQIPGRAPVVALRLELEAARFAGLPFTKAWPAAVERAVRLAPDIF